MASFDILTKITHIEVIAVGNAIHVLPRIHKMYGPGRWRKLKGVALVQFEGGDFAFAELHWYEAHGFGRREIKIKRLL